MFVFGCFWLSGCGDCFFWLFDVILFWLFIERLCFMRKKKNYGRTVHCKLPLLNPVSKWVRSDSNGWSFNLGVYCLLWKRFCVLNFALRMTKKLNRLRNSDGYVLVFKKTQRVVWPCFNCVDFMAQTVSAYSSAHKWFWLKKIIIETRRGKWLTRIEQSRCLFKRRDVVFFNEKWFLRRMVIFSTCGYVLFFVDDCFALSLFPQSNTVAIR